MLENPTDSSSTPNITTVKRYAPPNQRNRSLSRRKSGGDRFERTNNNYMNDGEKNQVATSRNIHVADHGDLVGSNVANDNPHSGLISLHGCSRSKAFQLLNDRWVAAISAYNDPSIDLADRPVMYSGSGASPWGQFRLPHQVTIENSLPLFLSLIHTY
ncbi:hypothetical protein CsSME_00041360 [Camellia sinensis var. sinensis]